MTCHGLNCACSTLIDAHIIPRAFARDVMGSHKNNVQVSMNNARQTHHGVYDPNILCAACNSLLEKFDDYGSDVSRRFDAESILRGGDFHMANVDGDLLAKFVLAVLWRASISKRPEFTKIALGPYEDIARDVLFGATALADMPSYELIVSRYHEARGRQLYTLPSRVTDLGVNGWGFAAGGFKFVAKMDKRKWPNLPAGSKNPYVVNGRNYMAGLFVNFAGSVEHLATLKMAGAQVRRDRNKTSRRSDPKAGR